MKLLPHRRFGIPQKSLSFAVFGVCLLACGCQNPVTTWTAESRSPDGTSVIVARRLEYSGPGNDDLYTTVSLKRKVYSNPPQEILSFDQNDVTGAEAAQLNLSMTWKTPSRLNVTYNGHAGTLIFQVAKCLGIDISTRDASAAAVRGSN